MPSDLQARYDALRLEMVQQSQRTAALEGHWLFYTLLGWQFFAAYALNHCCVQLWDVQSRWVLLAIKVTQFGLAVVTYFAVVGRKRIERSPLERPSRGLWLIFILICAYVEILNILAGNQLYVLLPAFPALASLTFAVMTRLFSKKFMLAGNFMLVVGVLMVLLPTYALVLYGAGWLVILQALGLWFLRDRRRWLAEAKGTKTAALPRAAGEAKRPLPEPRSEVA
jgi:hypothetical protein